MKMTSNSCLTLIGWSCFLLVQFDWSYQSSNDISSEISHMFDQAALDLLRSYDEERNSLKTKRRFAMLKEDLIFRKIIPMQTLATSYPADIVKISMQNDVNVTEHLIFIANQFKPDRTLNSTVDIYRLNSSTQMFEMIQSIKANGPYELEHLTVETSSGSLKHLLVVIGNSKHIIYEIKFEGSHLAMKEFQHFNSLSVDSVKSFTRRNGTYLVIAMRLYADMVTTSPSKLLVLRYNKKADHFQFHSTLPAQFVGDIEIFSVNDMLFMAVAYYKDKNGQFDLNSPLYIFSDKTGEFSVYQTIPTNGASDIEFFKVMNEHFLIVANTASSKSKDDPHNVQSSLFQYLDGKFQLVGMVATYGALKWKSLVLPTCKNVALLAYADQRNTTDQVGFFIYREGSRTLEKLPLSLYDSEFSLFRPMPRALATFFVSNEVFVAVGATNNTHGNTIYKIEYELSIKATETEKISSGILDDLAVLQQNLTMLEKDVQKLENAAAQFGIQLAQYINGTKIFKGNFQADNIIVDKLYITNGSLSILRNKTLFSRDFLYYGYNSTNSIMNDMEKQLSQLNISMNQANMVNANVSLTSKLNFSSIKIVSKEAKIKALNASSCIVTGIDICHLSEDIILKHSNDSITAAKTFSKNIEFVSDLSLGRTLNDVFLARDLVDIKSSQVINSTKIFEESLAFESVRLNGSMNGISPENDTLGIHKNETVYGMKTLVSDVEAEAIYVKATIDGIKVIDLKKDTMDQFLEQNVTGEKIFSRGSKASDNIDVLKLTNNLDLDSWSGTLVNIGTDNVSIPNDVIFEGKTHIEGNVNVGEKTKLNDLQFPNDFVLVEGKQEIVGRKEFNAAIDVKGNVQVHGLVDGVNINDTVSISTAQEINGKKAFMNNTSFLKNVSLAGMHQVNGINLLKFSEEVVTLHTKQNISGITSFKSSVETHNCIDITGNIGQLPVEYYEELLNRSVSYEKSQTVTGKISLLSNATVTANVSVNGKINGYDFPDSYLQNIDNQNISTSFTLNNVTFDRNIHIGKTISGFNVNAFAKDLIRIDKDQSVRGIKKFQDTVIVDKSVSTCCSINNITLKNLLTKNASQMIFADKAFTSIESRKILRGEVPDIIIGSTVDGIDLSEFKSHVLYMEENTTVESSMQMADVKIINGIQEKQINGVDLKMLKADIVTLDTDQVIPQSKNFDDMLVVKNVITNSTIDGYELKRLYDSTVKIDEEVKIGGRKTFREIKASDVEISGLVQGVNLSRLSESAVLTTSDFWTNGTKTISGNVKINSDIEAKLINDLNITKDLVLKNSKQTISGKKVFESDTKVNGNITIDGFLNDKNITSMYEETVLKSKEQHIKGKKVILNNLESRNDVTIGGEIDRVDLSLLHKTAVKTTGNIIIKGTKTFAHEVDLKSSMKVKGLINNQDFDSVTGDAVLKDNAQNITAHLRFKKSLDVINDVKVESGNVRTGLVNGVDVVLLEGSTMKKDSYQVITGRKQFKESVTLANDITIAKINGFETKDFVTLEGNQTVKGRKEFEGIKATGGVVVEGTTDGEKLADIAADTLLKSQSQVVTGYKNFTEIVIVNGNLTSNGLIDSKPINSKVVTIDTDQQIQYKTVFENGVVAQNITVYGRFCGCNMTDMYNKRVTVHTKQIVQSDFKVADLKSNENINLYGKVNGEDLSDWESSLASFGETTIDQSARLANYTKDKCPALNYVKDVILKDSPLYIDYVEMIQSFKYGVNHIEPFKIGNDYFIATVQAAVTPLVCKQSEVLIFNRTRGQFISYQSLSNAAGSRFKSLKCHGRTFLLLLNAENGCMPKGKSILYMWNATTLSFEIFQYIETSTATFANFMISGTKTFLAIANIASSPSATVSVWKYSANESRLTLHETKPSALPAAIEFFSIGEDHFMAVANSYDPVLSSTKTLSDVYKLNNISQRWDWLQGIPTTNALDVKHFTDTRHHFISFTSGKFDVYRYSNNSGMFVFDHSLTVPFPIGIDIVSLEYARYLLVVSKDGKIYLYRYRLHLEYELAVVIPQAKVTFVTHFMIDNKPHLAVGCKRNVDDKRGLEEYYPRILQIRASGLRSSNFNSC